MTQIARIALAATYTDAELMVLRGLWMKAPAFPSGLPYAAFLRAPARFMAQIDWEPDLYEDHRRFQHEQW